MFTHNATTKSELTQDEIFELLANRRRRFVIHALKYTKEALQVSTLAKYVAAWELDVDPASIEYEDQRNIYSTLRRTHLPKLDEKKVVQYDADQNLVEPTPLLEDLDVYIEVLQGREIPWSVYYVGLSGVAISVLLAVTVGVPGFAGLSPQHVAVFAITMFAVSSVVHYVYDRRGRLGDQEIPPELRR